MRLTLRTLLSYLDNVLDAPARAELEKQLELNENAGEWLHRTRDVMRRLKLGAPEIDGTSSVDDPNTVAEYLDRTLPEESVAEFERVCLESDAMLAEVASCHHVLAMVLADKPAIDPDTQSRLHRLQDDLANAMRSRVEAAHPPAPAEPPAPEGPATPINPGRPSKVEARAPDYLRDGEGDPLKKWLPAIAALALLAVTAALAFRTGGWLNPVEQVAQVDQEEEPVVEPLPPEAPEDESEGDEEAVVDPEPVDDAPEDAADEPAPGDETAPDESAPEEVADEPSDEDEPSPSEPEPTGPDTVLEGGLDPEPMADKPAEAETTDDAAAEPTPAPSIAYLSGAETLALREAEPGSWRRLSGGEELSAPTRLVSMPTYRSRYDLGEGVGLELVDLTEATVAPPSEEAAYARINLEYGRIVLRRDANAPGVEAPEDAEGGQVEVVIDGVPYMATLSPGAVLAIAADRPYRPGHPILETRTPLVAMAHGLAGKIEWESADVGLVTSKPRPWIIVGGESAAIPADVSDSGWVDQLVLTPADGYASPELARAVAPDQPVWPQLLEIAEQENFGEIRSLAGRCSVAIGHPDPVVDSFRIADESQYWEANLTTLREAASRSTAQAGEVGRVFAEMFGARIAEELVDLLIGFAPEEIGLDAEAVAAGVVPEVILPSLASDDLATRVLASLVLDEAIEPIERPYKPLDQARRRQQAIRRLEGRLEDLELEPRVR